MPSALTLSWISMRSSSSFVFGPRAFNSGMSMVSISDSFAMTIAFSAVPPMPMPSMPGGHQPAPMCGMDLFSLPPPLAATVTSTPSPGTSSTWITAGVLSFVLPRLPAGSATIDARSRLSASL